MMSNAMTCYFLFSVGGSQLLVACVSSLVAYSEFQKFLEGDMCKNREY